MRWTWRDYLAWIIAGLIGIGAGLSCCGCAVEARTATGDITLLRVTVNVYPASQPSGD